MTQEIKLPEPAFRLRWKENRGEYTVSKPNIGDTDCYTEDQLIAAIEEDRQHRIEAALVDTPTSEDMLAYAMSIAHERELRIGGLKHKEPDAVRRFEGAVQRLIDGHRQARGEPVAVNIHCVKLKSRKKMEATIPKERLGWWHDVCPGERMVLRDANDSDVARCIRKTSDTRGPEHFYCELGETGSLVSKDAIQSCQTFKVYAVAPQPQQQASEPVHYVMSEEEMYESLWDVAIQHLDSNGINVIEPEVLDPLIRSLVVAIMDEEGFSPQPQQQASEPVVPPAWLTDQYGGKFDELTAGQGYRLGWNDCRAAMLKKRPQPIIVGFDLAKGPDETVRWDGTSSPTK